MKLQLIAAASALVMLSAGGNAAAQTAPIGALSLDYSRNNLEVSGAEADLDVFQAEGGIALRSGGPYSARLDAMLTHFDSDDLGGDATVIGATGHFGVDLDRNSAGLFAGVEHDDEATLWGVGVEGKVNTDMASLYLQFGYGRADDLDGVDFWGARAEGNLFLNDNVRLGAHGGYASANGGGDLDVWNAGVDAEYQFANAPVSAFAGYERGELSDIDLTSDTFRIGARFTFGGSLRDRDRAGVGQGSVANLFGGTLGTEILGILGEFAQ